MEWYEANVFADPADESTSLVDLRTLSDDRLADLVIEAGAAGDSEMMNTIARILSDRALGES